MILVLVIYVYDLLVSGNETLRDKLVGVRNGQISTQTVRELEWYLGCAVKRD